MLKEKIEKMKSLIVKDGDNKKKIENLVVFIIILIITIIVINIIWKDNKKSGNTNNLEGATLSGLENNSNFQISSNNSSNNELEIRLENILSKIEGVGNVKVMITYSQTSQTIAMYNENNEQSDTQESDTQGRNKKSKRK